MIRNSELCSMKFVGGMVSRMLVMLLMVKVSMNVIIYIIGRL